MKMLFRIFVAFAFFVSSLRGQEEKKNFTEISYICEQRNGLTNEQVQYLNVSKPIVTDDYNVKCYLRCLLREVNLMNSEGDLIPDGVTNIKPEFSKYIVACLNTTGIEPCDKALNFENCVWAKKNEDEGGN